VGQNLTAIALAGAQGSRLDWPNAATWSMRLVERKCMGMLRACLDSLRPRTVRTEVEVARLSSCEKLAVR